MRAQQPRSLNAAILTNDVTSSRKGDGVKDCGEDGRVPMAAASTTAPIEDWTDRNLFVTIEMSVTGLANYRQLNKALTPVATVSPPFAHSRELASRS